MNPSQEQLRALDSVGEILRKKSFRPHFLLRNGHLQTIVASRQRRSFEWGWMESKSDFLDLDDGARIRLRVVVRDKRAPTVLTVHGMSGSSDSTYMLALSHKAHRAGWNAILPDLYNCNEVCGDPKIFHAGSSQDLFEILEKVSRKYGLEEFFLVGVSMGGNILLKMLGELDSDNLRKVRAAGVISPLVDLTASWQVFDKRSNLLYRGYYLKRLRELTRNNPGRLSNWIDLDRLAGIKTIKEFDELVTVPLGGFDSVFDYYKRASSYRVLGQIGTPTLILHSTDDPLLPSHPLEDQQGKNPFLKIFLTNRGGHVAFLEQRRTGIDRSWAENRVIDFFGMFD